LNYQTNCITSFWLIISLYVLFPPEILSYLSDAKGLSEKHRTKENPRVKVLDYKDGGQYLGAA